MARYSQQRIQNMLIQSDNAPTSDARGELFEDLVCYLFEKIPGVEEYARNVFNRSGTQEIDVAFWNKRRQNGLYFLNPMILTECKNPDGPVGSQDVGWFRDKIRSRGLGEGVMIATSGITGDNEDLRFAHNIIVQALNDRIKILVIDRDEILSFTDTTDLITLLQRKFGELVLRQNVM